MGVKAPGRASLLKPDRSALVWSVPRCETAWGESCVPSVQVLWQKMKKHTPQNIEVIRNRAVEVSFTLFLCLLF